MNISTNWLHLTSTVIVGYSWDNFYNSPSSVEILFPRAWVTHIYKTGYLGTRIKML